jgi:hypothetical protein
MNDLTERNDGNLTWGECKTSLSSGVGGTLAGHPGLGLPVQYTGPATGGHADVTRIKATRCFGGNHHAPGGIRLLTVNAAERTGHAQKFQISDMTCVTLSLERTEFIRVNRVQYCPDLRFRRAIYHPSGSQRSTTKAADCRCSAACQRLPPTATAPAAA